MADEPASEILDATYRALCEYGYANITLQDIAAEADTSKASIHYHYDSKNQLFVAFLDELYNQFTNRVGSPTGDTPREQLEALPTPGVCSSASWIVSKQFAHDISVMPIVIDSVTGVYPASSIASKIRPSEISSGLYLTLPSSVAKLMFASETPSKDVTASAMVCEQFAQLIP